MKANLGDMWLKLKYVTIDDVTTVDKKSTVKETARYFSRTE
jgi:hypothetical protein